VVDLVDALKAELRRRKQPFKVCICGDFKAGARDEGCYRTQCLNCGGWLTDSRLEEIQNMATFREGDR
jgi:hypothetical protein